MLNHILKLKGTKTLNKRALSGINGGSFNHNWPTNEDDCLACGGNWYAPLCELPVNSPCLS